MNEPKFSHHYRQEAYDKAMVKFNKMVETESGKKFFAHLVKCFIQSGTIRKVEDSEERKGVLVCDLTRAKIVTITTFNAFKGTFNAKIANFERNEDESDEAFQLRRDAYIDAFKSSNPYACNADFAYTADKTDKILCTEAVDALVAKFNSVKDDPTYSDLMKLIEVKVYQKNSKQKNQKEKREKKQNTPNRVKFVKSSTGAKSSGHSLGDNEVLRKLKEDADKQ